MLIACVNENIVLDFHSDHLCLFMVIKILGKR